MPTQVWVLTIDSAEQDQEPVVAVHTTVMGAYHALIAEVARIDEFAEDKLEWRTEPGWAQCVMYTGHERPGTMVTLQVDGPYALD